jgi:GTPase SAR1 family protein
MDEKSLQNEIETQVRENLFPLFEKYSVDSGNLDAILKWKPIALILGNYSSGKSTLINEILSQEVQRTGQAPTDDSFTIITAPDPAFSGGEVQGATLINNDKLPFGALKSYGEPLFAHFRMKYIDSPLLENLAIIDSPGMMDSVTEKGRGYDYLSVVADLTRLADLVVLMFDPHKAGTIKETYSIIRNTLPGTSREDRVLFVMSRIDDCDNPADLIRSYGTLCWNLSQMTGRKDIPRIFLTCSPFASKNKEAMDLWVSERNELSDRILSAPELRISHILHHVDRLVSQLKLIVEAMRRFSKGARQGLSKTILAGLILAAAAAAFADIGLQRWFGFPEETLVSAIIERKIEIRHVPIPVLAFIVVLFLTFLFYTKLWLPAYARKYRKNVDRLITVNSAYGEHMWSRGKSSVTQLLKNISLKSIFSSHQKHLDTIERFQKEHLQSLFKKIR